MKLAEAEGKRIEIPFLKEKSKFFHRNFCFSRRVPYRSLNGHVMMRMLRCCGMHIE